MRIMLNLDGRRLWLDMAGPSRDLRANLDAANEADYFALSPEHSGGRRGNAVDCCALSAGMAASNDVGVGVDTRP